MELKFRGSSPARVDEKGRFKMPAAFKHLVDEKYGSREVYITSEDGKRAQIYPLREWEEKEARIMKVPSMNPLRKKYLELTSYWGQQATMDDQGRVLIHPRLRDSAKLTAEVEVIGLLEYVEVAESETIKSSVTPLTAEENQAWSELGV